MGEIGRTWGNTGPATAIGCKSRAGGCTTSYYTQHSIVGTAVERILPFLSLLSRRRFLGTAGAATLAIASQPAQAEAAAEPATIHNENVALTVNGRRHALDLDPRVTLLDALREYLGLTGATRDSAAPAR